jgi:hypothetical protein
MAASTGPVITVAPTSGAPDLTVQVTGQTFPPRSGVSLYWDGSTTLVRTATVRADGTFDSTVTAPTSAGDHVLRALAKGTTATTTFRVLSPTAVATATPPATATPVPPTTTPPSPTTTAGSASYQYDFEDGTTQGWQPSGPGTAASAVASSQAGSFDGSRSLAVTLSNTTSVNWGSAWVVPSATAGPGTPISGRVQAGRQRVVVEKNPCNVDVSTDQRYARGKVELAGGQSYRFVARDLRTALRGRSGPILRPTLQT